MANEHIKRYSIPLASGEMKIKTMMDYHLKPIIMA